MLRLQILLLFSLLFVMLCGAHIDNPLVRNHEQDKLAEGYLTVTVTRRCTLSFGFQDEQRLPLLTYKTPEMRKWEVAHLQHRSYVNGNGDRTPRSGPYSFLPDTVLRLPTTNFFIEEDPLLLDEDFFMTGRNFADFLNANTDILIYRDGVLIGAAPDDSASGSGGHSPTDGASASGTSNEGFLQGAKNFNLRGKLFGRKA